MKLSKENAEKAYFIVHRVYFRSEDGLINTGPVTGDEIEFVKEFLSKCGRKLPSKSKKKRKEKSK